MSKIFKRKYLLIFLFVIILISFLGIIANKNKVEAKVNENFTVDFTYNEITYKVVGETKNFDMDAIFSSLNIDDEILEINIYDSNNNIFKNNIIKNASSDILFDISKTDNKWILNSYKSFKDEFSMKLIGNKCTYNITVTDPAPTGYTVTIVLNNGESDSYLTNLYTFEYPDEDPSYFGYVFDGYYLESTFETKLEEGYPLTNNITAYVKWIKIIKEEPSKDNGYKLVIDDAVLAKYNVFYDWYSEGNEVLLCTNLYESAITFPSTIKLEQTTYYCKIDVKDQSLIISHAISNGITPKEISFCGGDSIGYDPDTIYALENTKIDMPENPYTKEEYKFVGWNIDENAASGLTFTDNKYLVGSNDVTFYAIWKKIIKENPSKDNGYKVVVDSEFSANATYKWYKGEKAWGNATLYSLYYGSIGNNAYTPSSNTVSACTNSFIQVSSDITQVRFKFSGTGEITNCELNQDGYYYPPYDNEHSYFTVCVSNKGDNDLFTDIEAYGTNYIELTNENSNKLTNTKLSDASYICKVTLSSNEKATSSSITPIKITFNSNFGTPTDEQIVYAFYGTNITFPTTKLSRSGYKFIGWNTSKDSTTKLNSYNVPNQDSTLYAIWEEVTEDTKVEKVNPEYEIPTSLKATEGDTLESVTLPEGFTFQDSLTTLVGNEGENEFLVTFTPSDLSKYNVVKDIKVTISVEKAKAEPDIEPVVHKSSKWWIYAIGAGVIIFFIIILLRRRDDDDDEEEKENKK